MLEQPALRRAVGRPDGGRALALALEVRHEPGQLGAAGPQQLVEVGRCAARAQSPRRASISGPNGRPSVPTWTQPPSSTRPPDGAGTVGDLAEEARLADAGLAGDEDEGRLSIARGRQRRRDTIELVSTADQRWARDAYGHARHSVPRPGGCLVNSEAWTSAPSLAGRSVLEKQGAPKELPDAPDVPRSEARHNKRGSPNEGGRTDGASSTTPWSFETMLAEKTITAGEIEMAQRIRKVKAAKLVQPRRLPGLLRRLHGVLLCHVAASPTSDARHSGRRQHTAQTPLRFTFPPALWFRRFVSSIQRDLASVYVTSPDWHDPVIVSLRMAADRARGARSRGTGRPNTERAANLRLH